MQSISLTLTKFSLLPQFSGQLLQNCWFSCSYDGVTHQSPLVEPSNFQPTTMDIPIKEVDHNEENLFKLIFPLRLYLCTTNSIIATANLDIQCQVSNFELHFFPVNEEGNFNDTTKPCITVELDANLIGNSITFDDVGIDNPEVMAVGTTTAPTAPVRNIEAPNLNEINNSDCEKDSILKHFRLSIEIRSIGGLKRPSHVSLHFTYPFLGNSHFVRTKPMWVLANSETTIDGAAVTYDCVMSTDRISDIFASHPLRVTAFSKSHLGNNILGEVVVDLGATLHSDPPHSYRCPVTGKSFRQLKDYHKHRQAMLALAAAGRVSRAPSKDPVVIRATDSYLAFSPVSQTADTQSRVSAVVGDSKSNNYFVSHVVEGAKLRLVVVLEDIGTVGPEVAIPVKLGYKMHNGALYEAKAAEGAELTASASNYIAENDLVLADPASRSDLTPLQRAELARLRLDWEGWRRAMETRWREALQEKETQLKAQLEATAAAQLADKADNLRRAQEEQSKLEIRLRGSIDLVERQKAQLALVEQQAQMKLAQKTAELQLLQRRVKEEARATVEVEIRRADGLKKQLEDREEALAAAERRAREAEKDLDSLRALTRRAPETALREENARLRAQLEASKAETEKEARRVAEARLQAEHYRAQMHRLAAALKRERERGAIVARQELEQLRLEFLAREERYVLDGDRDELGRIRNELSLLRLQSAATAPSNQNTNRMKSISTSKKEEEPQSFSFFGYSPSGESKSVSPSPLHDSRDSSSIVGSDEEDEPDPAAVIQNIRKELRTILSSGLYDENNDELILELKRNLQEAEQRNPQQI